MRRSSPGWPRGRARGTAPSRSSLGVDEHDLRCRREALSSGVAFLPADRKRQGLLLDRSVADNVVLGREATGRSVTFTRPRATHRRGWCRDRTGMAAHVDVTVRTLSGGNQQKVMIGRWIGVDSRVLIFDEPTAGIDIASKFEIYVQLRGSR